MKVELTDILTSKAAAARYLGIDAKYVWRLEKEGIFPAKRGGVYYLKKDLDKLKPTIKTRSKHGRRNCHKNMAVQKKAANQ